MDLKYIFFSGKNPKLPYYISNYTKVFLPKLFFQIRLKAKLKALSSGEDSEYIRSRVNYYNKLSQKRTCSFSSAFKDLKKSEKVKSVYFLDAYNVISWFRRDYKWNFLPGDITYIPEIPSIVKSRPIHGNNENSVILKLVKVRHFIFVKDKLKFNEKDNKLIFRGKIENKPHRIDFLEKYFGNPMCDLGNVGRWNKKTPEAWQVEKNTIHYHFKFKFILALEGNDVASNLKWIMFSNSIAVMPEPKYETWFMEGKLIPGYHYIKIKDDYSDLEERLKYYIEHEEEALKIIKNANQYVSQFLDEEREQLISLAVMDKYLRMTSQKD
ncbi:glycosyl transferase family 90 [Salegentibacter sp. F188]|uniref:Glycosyl transferase family 90 n=1 Tax=Autumnicola patrickiae TaxID=3075591 RepID=A0ABU3DXM6_9FLAO|nr:glycosyl transferase family 90 [Salegentibacter sp. F188]MDT0688474.1 glycosyl transferase family 90 [Salegentibacter sp. F188]